jgi:hypothetical protein
MRREQRNHFGEKPNDLGKNFNVSATMARGGKLALRLRMQPTTMAHLLEGRVIFAVRQAKPGFVGVALPLG